MGILGNTQKNEVTTKSNLTGFQKSLRKATRPFVKQYLKKVTPTGVQLPKKPLVQPTNPLQTQGQQQALATVGAQNALGADAAAATSGLLGADPTQAGRSMVETWQDPNAATTDFLLNKVLYPGTNPALQGAIDAAVRPITQNLTESQLPAVRSGAYTTGNFGSSRQGIAEGLASGRASQAIGDTAAGVANQGYQAGLGALSSAYGNILNASTSAYGTKQNALSDLYSNNVNAKLNALGLTPQVQGSQLSGALTTSGVGDVQQAQAQRQRDEAVYRKLYAQMAPLQSAESLLALAGAVPGGSTTVTGATPGTSPVQGILGGASLGAALLPGLGPLGVLGGAAAGGAASLFD